MKTKTLTQNLFLGLLMSLVLAFGVLGNLADAATISLTSSGTSADLSWRDIGGTIDVSISATANLDTTVESVTFSVSNGATFTLADPTGVRNTHTWRETGAATGTFESTISGSTASIPSSVTLTVPRAGEVTVTLSATGATSQTLTFYVVKDRFTVASTDTVSLLNITNGVGGRYSGNVKIHSGDGRNNPVTYRVTGAAATLYIQKGTDTTRQLTSLASVGSDGQTSSNADVWLDMAPDTSSTVTAWVTNGGRRTQGVYIHGNPSLTVATTPTTFAGPPDSASQDVNGTTTPNAIAVTVNDQTTAGVTGTTAVANVPVKFDASATGGSLIPTSTDADNDGFSDNIVDARNNPIMHAAVLPPAQTVYVRTSGSPVAATVGFQFGTTPGKSEIQVSINGRNFATVTEKVEARVTGGGTTTLTIDDNKRLSGNSKRFELIALVERDGETVRGLSVTFRTRQGLLRNTPTGDTLIPNPDDDPADNTDDTVDDNTLQTEMTQVTDVTDRSGKARVIYDLGSSTGRQEIDAIIYEGDPKDKRQITFVINGAAGSGGGGGGGGVLPPTPTARLTLTPGGSGTTRTVTVNALQADGTPIIVPLQIRVSGTPLLAAPQVVTTGTPVPITVPSTPGTYRLTAIDPSGAFANATLDIPVTVPGTLEIQEIGARAANGGQTIEITVRDSSNALVSDSVLVTLRGAVNRAVTITGGSGRVPITLPTTGGPHTVTLSADGYTERDFEFSASGQTTGGSQPQQPTGPAGVAASLKIDGSRSRSGTVNQSAPLRVQVLDANGTGVSDVRVTFRVLAPGKGRLSQRGNGRADVARTDRRGYASATLTPLAEGTLIVEAKAAKVTAPVTFIIAVGEASETEPDTGTGDTAQPPRREINPVVHVDAAKRSPMLWVDGGVIYALVGTDIQRFIAGVDNALNIAIAGDKVYWTAKKGSGGTINSANLDGTGVKELVEIHAVPMGITVDMTNSKLYWTNSRSRIQRMNIDGTGRIENILQDLPSPLDIALAEGNVYWTHSNGGVGFVNLKGQKQIRNISNGANAAGSLAIDGGKVYWTETQGESGGRINSANLDGTGVEEIVSILAIPSGIAIDTARGRIFWTNSRGRIQSAELDGSNIKNVVGGLGMPGDMVISNSIKAPVAMETDKTPAKDTPTASKSKYDVNGDGTVDSMDVDALIVAVSAGVNTAKYDVNNDKKVDILDIKAVNANLDEGTAAAPTLLGTKLSALQVDRLQEQIELLIATGDRSPAAIKTLIYLQQLIAMASPEKTQLLANYPNPFNPETWIPYELATDANVKITIYNTHGVVIRTLELGHQSAGYYTGRDRAAYWDGRNAFGEQVASGVYFYQFETDAMSAMRKMVILK